MSTEFGTLLRKHRLAAEVSQEELAAVAGISASAIGGYERGLHAAPHRQTIALLADALKLTGQARLDFEVAAKRKPRRPANGLADEQVIGGLPVELTSFFGRELEVARLQDLLRNHRLVTVTGSGGIGKTRVALRAASAAASSYRIGIAFVDLSSTSSATSVMTQIALATGVPFTTANRPEDLATRLSSRELLLFVDNCEHVIEAAATVISAILKHAPSVKVLATSRERLRLAGEMVFRVPTLPVPENSASTAQQIAGITSVELFVDRAKNLDSEFRLTDSQVEAVADICRQLDGIPLALELAAARLSTLGLTYLREQVKRTITVLSTSNRDVPTHQSTLEATLAWSHALLTPQEQILFRRLSVFAGGWTLTAAQRVCAGDDLPVESITSVLTSLVEKSLITVDLAPDQPRYDFLRVTWHFANTKAQDACEREAIARQQAEWVAERVQFNSELTFLKRPQLRGLSHEVGIENVRAAADWSLTSQMPAVTSNILWGSQDLFFKLGLVGENLDFTRRALLQIDEAQHPREAAQLYGVLATAAPINERVRALKNELRLWSQVGEERWIGLTMINLAWSLTHVGRPVEAEGLALEGMARLERLGYDGSFLFARGLRAIGEIYSNLGNFAKARDYIRRAAKLSAHLQNDADVIRCLSSESELAFLDGDRQEALSVADRAIGVARTTGFRREEMYLITTRAAYHLTLGNISAARDDARTALNWAANNDRVVILTVIQHLATVAALSQKPELAANLIGFSDRELKELGGIREPTEETCFQILEESLKSQRSPDRIQTLWIEGGQYTSDEAIALALTV